MLYLSREDVRAVLDVDQLIDALSAAFVALSAGRASVPPRGAAAAPGGLLAGMAGYVPGALAAKLVTLFPGTDPAHKALIVLFDEEEGSPIAVMDGTEITAMRTAAASAVAARALARPEAHVLAIVGASVQGESHARALPRVREFDEIRITSRDAAKAEALAAAVDGTATTVEAAVTGADVVCLCTNAHEPVIEAGWIAPGAHVGSVGHADVGGELPRDLLNGAVLAVESRVAFQPPLAGAAELQGLDPASGAELGELIAGTRPGRTNADQITVYKSMGHAVEDAAAARLVYDAAVAAGRGTHLEP